MSLSLWGHAFWSLCRAWAAEGVIKPLLCRCAAFQTHTHPPGLLLSLRMPSNSPPRRPSALRSQATRAAGPPRTSARQHLEAKHLKIPSCVPQSPADPRGTITQYPSIRHPRGAAPRVGGAARKQCVGRNNVINKLGKVRRPTNSTWPRGGRGRMVRGQVREEGRVCVIRGGEGRGRGRGEKDD